MQNLLKVFFLLTIYFAVETENHVIRSRKSHTKRMATAAPTDQEASSSMNVTLHFRNIRRKDSEDSIENDSGDDLSSYPQYKFAYKVYDPETGDDKEHEESRDGELVQGEYSFVEPDGSRRIVKYTSNGTEGFNAVITKLKAPTDSEIQQAEELIKQQEHSETSASSANENESSYQDTEQNHETSESVQDETETQEAHETQEALASPTLDIINVENTTDAQEDNVNTPAKRSDESASTGQRKFDNLSADEEHPAQNPDQKRPNQERSRKRSVLSNITPEPQYIKYMFVTPQNFYIPVNSNKEEVVSNYKENLKSAVKKQKKSIRESREISSFYFEKQKN